MLTNAPLCAIAKGNSDCWSPLDSAFAVARLLAVPALIVPWMEMLPLEASSVLDTHNVIEFEIHGFMWAQPVPLELLLRTQVDLEAGQVEVRDVNTSAVRRAAR